MKTLADIKRRACKGAALPMTHHSWFPNGDLIGVARPINHVQGNAVAFQPVEGRGHGKAFYGTNGVLILNRQGYEVRSGDVIVNPQNILQLIEYDERWNVRPDGTATDLTCVFSGTLHWEVAAPGVTLGGVQAWIVTRLTTP